MGCGCKKAAQQAAGARAARPKAVSRSGGASRRSGYQPRTYFVLPVDADSYEDADVVGEEYPTLAEAHKRIRDLGPGWFVEARYKN